MCGETTHRPIHVAPAVWRAPRRAIPSERIADVPPCRGAGEVFPEVADWRWYRRPDGGRLHYDRAMSIPIFSGAKNCARAIVPAFICAKPSMAF
jgi:hypothetical protein